MIDRMDRNNNGMIDPDEMEGPAQMMISRLQREDPSIRTDRSIPVAKIKEAFEQMRGGRGPGDRGEGSGVDTREQIDAALTPAPLVPGFGEPQVLEPVLGFGPAAELMSVEVTPADLKSAEEALQRYDRNRDGFVSGEEVSRRWPGNPMDFDRNGDGKLSLSELAVRAARLRVVEVEVREASNRRNTASRGERDAAPAETPDPFNGRRSFATTSRSLPEGLPGWFAERDRDGDQQVSMAEYSSQWTASLVEEFQQFDRNGDGFITVAECLAAVRGGATAGGGASALASNGSRGAITPGSSGEQGSRGSRYGRSSRPSFGGGPANAAPAATGSAAAAASTAGEPPSTRNMEYAQRIIGRNDKDQNGVLTADEWKDMLIDPSPADADKDGRITPLEYAQWMQARSNR